MATDIQDIKPRGGNLYRKVVRFLERFGFREESFLVILAVFIGLLTGLGSVGFSKLIELAHRVCYGRYEHLGLYGGRGLLLMLLPAGGALLVGVITYFFAREAKGHGVPEVMDAIARRDGRIRPRVAFAKAISSALTIGSGGSAGTEGPIIQIGATIGSTAGQFFQISKNNMPVLVGCGAAGGISAIFHAPIAGVLFAMEIFLRDINFKSFSPVLIASVVSSVVVSLALGNNDAIFPLLNSDSVHSFQWFELGNYFVLGLICAVVAVAFIKLLYATEDFFSWLKVHDIVKPVMDRSCVVIHDDLPLQNVMDKALGMEVADFIVVGQSGNYLGLLVASDLRMALLQPESVPLLVAGELARTNVPEVGPDETLDTVLNKFALLNVDSLPVHSNTDKKNYIGMITRAALMRRYQQLLHGQT